MTDTAILAPLEKTPHLRAIEIPGETLEFRDGLLTGLAVPWDRPALVMDRLPDGGVDIYHEGFRRGTFDAQISGGVGHVGRVYLKHTHEDAAHSHGFLGHARALRDSAAGLITEFRVASGKRADVADMIEDGIDGLSVEFRERRNTTVTDGEGIRWRTAGHLDGVALDPLALYAEARVLQYRAELDAEAAETARVAAEAAQSDTDEEARQRALQEQLDANAARLERIRAIDGWRAENDARQAELAEKYLRAGTRP